MAEILKMDDARKSLVDWALEYAARGVRVFATTRDGKAPSTSNRQWSEFLGRELVKGEGGLNQATTDEEVVRWMFQQYNAGGIGMPCGRINKVIVLDLDLHKEKPDGNAHAHLREFWDEIEQAHTVETRSGGLHVYFDYEPGHRKKQLGENIEVQSDGAYVLLPPSKGYKVKRHVLREDWERPPFAPVGPELAKADALGTAKVPDHVLEMARLIKDRAHWHDPVRDIVAHMVGSGFTDREILWWTMQWTFAGHNWRQTYQQICEFIDGARAKGWGEDK